MPRYALLWALLGLQGLSLVAQAPAPLPVAAPAAPDDSLLAALLKDAFAQNPQLGDAEARLEAERARVPQAGTLPDPIVTLGYQNDGFSQFQYGRMETTWATVMATQAFPAPGKRRLRENVAEAGAKAAEATIRRLRLGLEAEVRRTYVGLLLARAQLRILDEQERLWRQAEAVARARYTVGQAPQVDLLRAQVELTRAAQVRAGLEAQEEVRRLELNRLAGRPADQVLETSASLEALPEPVLPADPVQDAEARSPELLEARHHVLHADRRVELARLDRRPDFTVSAGVMPRGALEPMWQVSVGVSLPVFNRDRSRKAVVEQEALRRAEALSSENLKQVLDQRTRERLAELRAVQARIRLTRDGLLVQEQAALQSALAQYEAGKVPFSTVLEGLQSLLADRNALLGDLAQLQALGIALREASPGPTIPVAGGGTLGARPMGSTFYGPAAPAASMSPSSAPSAPAAPAMAPM